MIVGIGEVLWDLFPDGRKVAGGAPFNFVFHCNQLGHEAVMVSRVGDDKLGRELREVVKQFGMTDEFLQTDRDHPTGTVRVQVASDGQPTYTIIENVAWDFIDDAPIAKLVERCRAVCFGTLAQRKPTSLAAIRRAVESRFSTSTLRVFDVNLRPTGGGMDCVDWGIEHADWVKLNEDELERFAEHHAMWTGDADFTALNLFRSCLVTIVTKGGNGVTWCQGAELVKEPRVPAKVVDTVGAGDAFTAAMVCLHLEGRPLRDCARFASHYAALVCEHQGATPRLDRADIEKAAFS